MPAHSTEPVAATPEAIRQAAGVLRRGGLVAFPTETVYGLGVDAENADAIRALFAAKGRPADHPVIVHLADAAQLTEWALDVPPAALRLAAAFWPGPMTLVMRRSPRASDLVTGGLATVGLRVPAHPVARALLQEFGGAIAAPSANRFGRVSPTSARHVWQELAGRVDIILDGGPCQVGLESTIIDLSGEPGSYTILRPGGVTAEQVGSVLGPSAASARHSADVPRVSGGLPSHYAPAARVELLAERDLAARARELVSAGVKVAVLSPVPLAGIESLHQVRLPPALDEQAQSLYAALRAVDEAGCDVALAVLPAQTGLGAAIADRLRKAAGPREGTSDR